MYERGSVSDWIEQVKDGRESAAFRLWQRYGPRMKRLARAKAGVSATTVADEDDVVICAFESFLRRVREGGYPLLGDRAELWSLLAKITSNKGLKQQRNLNRQKRGGHCEIRSFDQSDNSCETLAELASREPSPQVVASMNDTLERLLTVLGDDDLQEIAIAKIHGYTNPEIAAQQHRSLPTIERRLRLIREVWQEELDE